MLDRVSKAVTLKSGSQGFFLSCSFLIPETHHLNFILSIQATKLFLESETNTQTSERPGCVGNSSMFLAIVVDGKLLLQIKELSF